MELRAEEISQIIKEQITDYDKKVELSETGVVLSVGDGIARMYGLEKAMANRRAGWMRHMKPTSSHPSPRGLYVLGTY